MAKILKRLFGGNPNQRQPSFAGLMYPKDRGELQALVDDALAKAPEITPWRAAIVPHSDLKLVGELAARAYKGMPDVERIVVLGPSQRVPFRGIALSSADEFACPTGAIPVDRGHSERIASADFVRYLDNAHTPEPSIELQLPFLVGQKKTSIVPLLVGDLGVNDLAWVLEEVWDDRTALVIAAELSTDYDADEAEAIDTETAAAIMNGDQEMIGFGASTARNLVRALLVVTHKRALKAEELARCTSADLGGPKSQVRGFGVWVWR